MIGVGVLPNTDFLADSGLALDNGVLVNQRFETQAPGVFAAGDVANFFDPLYGRQRRIEHWSNANYQGTEVGRALAGSGDGYGTVSSFFSEVFGTTVKIFGDVSRFDALTTEGSLTSGTLLISYGAAGQLVGALTVGASDELEVVLKNLIAEHAPIDALEQELVGGRVAMRSRLHQLSALGQSVWIDYLSRDLIESGALARAIDEDAVVGDRDVAAAFDLLRPVWERTEAHDGYVSIEVEPTLAAEEMTARGYSINVTLIFSLSRHRQIAEAYLRGLERLVAAGGDPSHVHSVTSFFVSRVDSETDRRLAPAGRDDLKGRLGIANAKLAYQQYQELFAGERWEALVARGATKQRCLWASTSTKDPSLRDTLYVDELIGPETISTMPAETIEAFQDHGRVEARLESGLQEAHYLFNRLYAAGVDYEDVVATLEREGIDKFIASYTELLYGIVHKRQQLAVAV